MAVDCNPSPEFVPSLFTQPSVWIVSEAGERLYLLVGVVETHLIKVRRVAGQVGEIGQRLYHHAAQGGGVTFARRV